MNCALAVLRFSRAPSPRTRFFIFFVELFHGKVRHSFCGPEVPSSFPRPPPQAIDRERNTTRNQHRNGKPDLEASISSACTLTRGAKQNQLTFRRAPIAGSRARTEAPRPPRQGRRAGTRSVGRGVEGRRGRALRSPLSPPKPPQPLLLQAKLSFFETPLHKSAAS